MSDSKSELIKKSIRTIPDYPRAGILFRDITTLLKNPSAFSMACELLKSKSVKFPDFDFVAGIEARGFVFGSVLAHSLGKGFVLIRKPGKLPAKIASVDYELEYGKDTVEVHVDAIIRGAGYLVVDDLLATGGTANASCTLIENSGGSIAGCMFVVELPDLNGRKILKDRMVYSILQFEGE